MRYEDIIKGTELSKTKKVGPRGGADVSIAKHSDGYGFTFRNRVVIKCFKADAVRVIIAGKCMYFIPANNREGFAICFKKNHNKNDTGYMKMSNHMTKLEKWIGDYDLEYDKESNLYYIEKTEKVVR